MKKILAFSLCSIMLFSSSIFAYAQEADKVLTKIKSPTDTLKIFDVGEPVYEHENPVVKLASVTVNVTSPCDEEWRASYSNWSYQANRAVERADDELDRRFGIDFYSVAQPLWSSSNTTSNGLLSEARSKHGLTYNSSQTADLMIAFSGVTPTNNSLITGSAYVSQPYTTIFDNGFSMNAETVQHEAGHMYGALHCHDESGSGYDGSDCVMTAEGFGNIDRFCNGHRRDWDVRSSWY